MQQLEPKVAIGVYSDSAFSGVDVCILTTDGLDLCDTPVSLSRPYPPELKDDLETLKKDEDFVSADHLIYLEEKITAHMIAAIKELIEQTERTYPHVDVIGISGQTVYHNPVQKVNITLANADAIANTFGCPVINRFIQSDLKAGGKGGPLLATFFELLTRKLPKPLVFASLGGISALTYIGQNGELMSFDVGPGNILLDTWVNQRHGQEMDFDGLLGAKGHVDDRLLKVLMRHPYLSEPPPKSADRNEFNGLLRQVEGSDVADGAATLTVFIAKALVNAATFLPEKPALWILAGGGTFNPTLVLEIKKELAPTPVTVASDYGWNKNTLASQGYAFLAVRALFNLPISFPSTTGVGEPTPGGQIHNPTVRNISEND